MLYINGRFLTHPMTGVERYAYMVCKTLATLGHNFTIISPKAAIRPCYDVSNLPIVYYGHGHSHIWEQLVLPFFFVGKRDYLLLSLTGLGSIFVRHKVMTIHDLSFLENPRWFSKAYYWYYRLMTPLAVRTSQSIITVSEFSKQEIMRFYPFVSKEKINVVYNGVDTQQFRHLDESPTPAEHFALAVSSLDPRKNFARLIEVFNDIHDLKLYIVGSAGRIFAQQTDKSTSNDNIRYLGRVSDDDLLRLYNQAACFIFPSIYEGFGLPPIEAMACGCPVLVSDIPVCREVCTDAALYFNPYDTKSIQDCINHFLNLDKKEKADLLASAYNNVCRFSWEASAKIILALLRNINPMLAL